MVNLDLAIEQDAVGEFVVQQQHQGGGVKTALPIAVERRILLRPELHLAVHAEFQTFNGRGSEAEEILVRGLGALRWRRRLPLGLCRGLDDRPCTRTAVRRSRRNSLGWGLT